MLFNESQMQPAPNGQAGAFAPRLDTWIASPAVRTFHTRLAAASPKTLWQQAGAIRLGDTRVLGRVICWRIPGLEYALTYQDLFRKAPFTLLEEGDRHLLSGLCGRIWTIRRDYAPLRGPGDFRQFDQPGCVRVLFAHWVEPVDRRRCMLVSETRVEPVDRLAEVRLRALWAVLGVFDSLIATEPLSLAVQRAEALSES
jgi:hypothetical protein